MRAMCLTGIDRSTLRAAAPRLAAMMAALLGLWMRTHAQETVEKKIWSPFSLKRRGMSKIHQVSWTLMKVMINDAHVSGWTGSHVVGGPTTAAVVTVMADGETILLTPGTLGVVRRYLVQPLCEIEHHEKVKGIPRPHNYLNKGGQRAG